MRATVTKTRNTTIHTHKSSTTCKMIKLIFCFKIFLVVSCFNFIVTAKNDEKKKKDIRDYSEADLENLFEQWEENDEPLEQDELPEWKKPKPKIDLSKIDPTNPENVIQMSKKGQTLMMFVSISGNPTEKESETITQIWQGSLFNANYEVQRYMVESNRAMFMLKDGSKAWEVKNFLLEQDRCESVTIEGKDYYGKGSTKYKSDTSTKNFKKTHEPNEKRKDKKLKKVKPVKEEL